MSAIGIRTKIGTLLYVVVVLLAFLLRFTQLDHFPLSNSEAAAALEAAYSTPFASPFFEAGSSINPQPSYETLTRGLFQIFSAENFFARMVPALAGVLLVLTPLLARNRVGFGHSLFMSLLLAVSPIFVTLSRTASGSSLAALGVSTFLMALLGQTKKSGIATYLIAGLGLGLALSSGLYVFIAIISIGIGLLIWGSFPTFGSKAKEKLFSFQIHLIPILWLAVIALIALATGFGWSIDGLSRFFDSFGSWVQGWRGESPYAPLTLLAMIPTYMPLLGLFGLLGMWSSFRDRNEIGKLASVIALVGLLTSLLYPNRQPSDLLWLALPLVFVTSKYLLSLGHRILKQNVSPWTIAVVVILVIFCAMAYLQMATRLLYTPAITLFDLGQIPATFLVLSSLVVLFFGLGWSWRAARISVILALLCITLVLSVSGLWRLSFSQQVYTAKELWRSEAPSQGLGLLVDTIRTTSRVLKGVDEGLSLDIIGDAPTYLIWAVREFKPPPESTEAELPATPVILVDAEILEPALPADYIGQTITIGESWAWYSILPPDFIKWWIQRDPPVVYEDWLVLIRQDVATSTNP